MDKTKKKNKSKRLATVIKFRESVMEHAVIQCVPLANEPGISLMILPLIRILQRLQTHTTDTFLFISHTTNVLLFKFRCNIFIGVGIIKEMPGSVASGAHCIIILYYHIILYHNLMGQLRICGPSLTETSLCGAYMYLRPHLTGQ